MYLIDENKTKNYKPKENNVVQINFTVGLWSVNWTNTFYLTPTTTPTIPCVSQRKIVSLQF